MAAVILRASDMARAVSWWRLGALAALLAVILLLYQPAVGSLLDLWVDGDLTTYTHGYLIAGLSCWLLFRQRTLLAQNFEPSFSVRQRLFLFAGLFASAMLWQFMFRAGILIAVQLLLLPLLWLSIAAVFGRQAARAGMFPIGFLIFAIPVWDCLNPYVHELTVHAVRLLLRLAGIPVFFEGDEVHIPEGVFEIEDGCSGLHFLMVALAIGSLTAELRGSRLRGRLGWPAFAAGLAILVNWIRVSAIVLLGHFTDMQHYVVRVSHYYFGWVLFAIALILFFAVERRIAEPQPVPARAGTFAPKMAAVRGTTVLMLLAIIVAALPLLMNRVIDARTPAIAQAVSQPPGWTSEGIEHAAWRPLQVNADRESLRRFVRGEQVVEVYEATYSGQRPGKKLGGSGNRIQGDASVLTVATLSMLDGPWREMVIEHGGEKSLLWFRYRVAEQIFVDATRAQFWYSAITLKGTRSTPSDVRALRVRCGAECASARHTLERFTADEG